MQNPEVARTRVVNVKTEECDVYVGRAMPGRAPSPYGNPFRVGVDGTLAEVLRKYSVHLMQQPELTKNLAQFRGKRLGCWCAPRPCHADILVRLIEGDRPTPPASQRDLFEE